MYKQLFTFMIGGEAGFGITSAGLTFSKIAARSGYHTFDYMEYPSIIRGGHNVVKIMVAGTPVRSQYLHTDFLVALNQDTVSLHLDSLRPTSAILYDKEQKISLTRVPKGVQIFDIPLFRIARDVGGTILARQTVALGASLALLGGDLKYLTDLVAEEFAGKSEKLIINNQAAAKAGFDYAVKNYPNGFSKDLQPRRTKLKQLVVNGNEAMSLGAIAAGMQFVAIYPMTPTSNILHILAPLQEKYGFIYKQPEDEISAINMAIGASFAGARSMVATAGGGFCLMTEAYGLSGMTETPVVIIEGMRGAPATGLPTWTEQGDARFVLHAHQGDFPRIVLAAGDAEEAFHLTMEAFNLADIYQTPVVLLVDKQLCESHQSVQPFDYDKYKINRGKFTMKKIRNYKRYAISPDGISLRATAGSGNHVVANSDEHTAEGYSSEGAANRDDQMQKRMQKLVTCEKESMAPPQLFGPKNADITILSWGSNKGAILEAMKELPSVNFLYLIWLSPFPTEAVKKILSSAKSIVNIEGNYTAQVGGLVTEKTGIQIAHQLLKYDGRPFYPEEILEFIQHLSVR